MSTPSQYAEKVLGKAATPEQLKELFELHAAAHPVVTRKEVWSKHLTPNEPGGENVMVTETRVELWSHNPSDFQGPPAASIAFGVATQNPDDEFNKRLGVTIAFGRALVALRVHITGQRRLVVQ